MRHSHLLVFWRRGVCYQRVVTDAVMSKTSMATCLKLAVTQSRVVTLTV